MPLNIVSNDSNSCLYIKMSCFKADYTLSKLIIGICLGRAGLGLAQTTTHTGVDEFKAIISDSCLETNFKPRG